MIREHIMLVSARHRFVFVHVPRTAGTSIAQALSPYRDSDDLPLQSTRHEDLRSFLRRNSDRDFTAFFKFAFVRNPWDRMVSYFHFLKSRQSGRVPEVDRLTDFSHFIRELDQDAEWLRSRHAVRPQTDFITGQDAALLVDFVGRYESLADDFKHACRQVGVGAQLPRENSTSHGSYRDYYDAHSQAVVEKHYRDDIARFGYVFE